MTKSNYYLYRDRLSGEILYLEYDKVKPKKLKGYDITPKAKVSDAINVSKIVFINPSLSEKLIKKKIDIKIRHLLKQLEAIDEDPTGGDEGAIKQSIIEAERLRVMILNTYRKYLGNTYGSLSIKKIQIIINQLRIKLYNKANYQRFYNTPNDLYYLDEEETKKGRGR